MSSVIGGEKLLDDGDSSLISSPIYKRPKIPALCDSPNVHGPISTCISMQKRELEAYGKIEGDGRKRTRDICEVKGKIYSKEPRCHDMSVCSNGVELAASSSVKRTKVEEGNEKLLEIPVFYPKPPSAWKDTGILDLKEPARTRIKHKVVDNKTSVRPCLPPHHPDPPNLGWKEQKCPSRWRVSPLRDFPAGRGRKTPRFGETQDKHLAQFETGFKIHKAAVGIDANRNGGGHIQQGVFPGKSRDVLEDPLRSHKAACVQMVMQAPLFSKSSRIKRQEEKFKDSYDELGKGMKQSKNNGKEITSPIKDKYKKKNSIEFSHGNVKFEDGITGVEMEKSFNGCVGGTKGNCSPNKIDVRRKILDTLRLFHGVLRKLVQADEKRTEGRVDASIQLIAAAKILKDHGKYINTKKLMGPVPGVEIGDLFNYRLELTIIGLHRQVQRGIDFIKQDGKILAISVVASGRYDNNMVNADVVIYSGQGGNVAGGCKQLEDQKLEEGNLALKNSIDKKNLVRVIRGFKGRKQVNGIRTVTATYIYDGLYTVERYWQDRGPHGKLIYKFELRRAPDQPEVPKLIVKKPKKPRKRKGRSVDDNDISRGKEKHPIFAVNTIDDEKPPSFTYITAVTYPDWCQPLPPKGCDCKDGCSDSKHCACALKNGGEIPYNYSGAIVEEKPLVYECGPSCKCPPTCHNRVSQHRMNLALEIFKTKSRGWGVRSLSSIPSGGFVCEYIGELLDDSEAEQRIDNDEYLFDIGQNYNDPTLREELSALMPDMPPSSSDVVENVGFTLDPAKYGNVGRFINHSCSPNLFAQNVLYDHDDKRLPHIMFFAAQNIPPLQELTFDYNYAIDQVLDSKGNIKKKSCYCGSSNCTGRMY